jgi:hypothetical protein
MKVVGTSPDQHVSFKNHYLNFITCFCWEDVERKKISIKKICSEKTMGKLGDAHKITNKS